MCEFSDPDFVVLMVTPEIDNLERVLEIMKSIPKLNPINEAIPSFQLAERAMSIRQAITAPFESLPIEECLGRVVAITSVGCPPAVPIIVAGEVIDESTIQTFKYYGIKECNVVK